jgi:diguanylate cyclase (GGDEF)-like protein
MDDYIYIYDLTNDYYYISPSAVNRFALPGAAFNNVVTELSRMVFPPDYPALQEDLNDVIAGKKEFHNMQYRWMSVNNEPLWINCRGLVVKNEDSLCMIGCINEIGKQPKADNVSGLLGLTSLEIFFNKNHAFLGKGYILRLGLDDFKEINEKLGIEYGNQILRRTADCIRNCLQPNQRIYRGIADEFIVLDLNGNDETFASAQYRNIRSSIDKLVEETHYEAVFTISGGILTSNNCVGHSFSDIMKFSEFSLNEAKRRGKNRCFVFENAEYDKFLKRRRITELLSQAVTHDFEGFEAYLQPLFNTNDNTLYGAEALMRFHTEEFGMVSPGEFIPLLEETGLIVPVGKWMLCKSLELCREIHRIAPDFRISINISYIQVLKSNIITEILSALADYDICPSTVIIELTESGLVASDTRVTKLCSRMKECGIRLALDDFGTGYSNFHYFNDLKPDIIKIDRTFTVKAIENDYEFNLLSLMTDMAHTMNMKVCIEGIETVDELNKMKTLTPDYCQGYYFGKPCPFPEFKEKFLSA